MQYKIKKGTMGEDKSSPKTPAQLFSEEYELLCKKHGVRILAVPSWVATNHNSFEMTIQYHIAQLPKEQNG